MIPLVVKTIQLDWEELECVEEKGVAVASAGIGARAVSVRSHEHSRVLVRQAFDGVLSDRLFHFGAFLAMHDWRT